VARRIGGGTVAKIFLSYARENADAAKALAECVGRAGHDVWWDREIQGGSRFASEIDRALKDAEAVVVLWSETSVDSAWVQDEAAEGRDTGRLVPLTLGSCRPPLGFRQFHAIPLGDWKGLGEPRSLGELVSAIDKVAGCVKVTPPASPKSEARPRRGETSVCVLPFANMSGDPEQEYFSDGITEDIITDLSNVSSLSVVARNTAFTLKGRSIDVKEVARELGVDYVLEGSVRKAGSRVRITAQLIDGAAGDHLWAERFDRELTDIFAIQDEISKAIVGALQLKLLPEEKKAMKSRGTASVDAYNLYLMARQQWIDGVYGDIRKDEAIVRICKQAVLLDPNYARAWALMALAQAELRFWHGTSEDALPAAERALALDPDLPEARCVKARYLENEGREAEAMEEIVAALRLDPESWEVNREAARLMFRLGRIGEAIPYFEKSMDLMNNDFHSGGMLLTCYRGVGDPASVRRISVPTLRRAKAAIAKDPANGAALANGAAALLAVGENEPAKEWIQRALLLDPDNVSMLYNLACGYAALAGDVDGALDMFGRFFERLKSTTILKHSEVDPDLDTIRDHPRFKEMMSNARQRLGLAG
jgi:adenylate cyclase